MSSNIEERPDPENLGRTAENSRMLNTARGGCSCRILRSALLSVIRQRYRDFNVSGVLSGRRKELGRLPTVPAAACFACKPVQGFTRLDSTCRCSCSRSGRLACRPPGLRAGRPAVSLAWRTGWLWSYSQWFSAFPAARQKSLL